MASLKMTFPKMISTRNWRNKFLARKKRDLALKNLKQRRKRRMNRSFLRLT